MVKRGEETPMMRSSIFFVCSEISAQRIPFPQLIREFCAQGDFRRGRPKSFSIFGMAKILKTFLTIAARCWAALCDCDHVQRLCVHKGSQKKRTAKVAYRNPRDDCAHARLPVCGS